MDFRVYSVDKMDIRIFLVTLIAVTIVGIGARLLRLPYSPLLVVAGTVLGFWSIFPIIHFSPQLLFTILLPPLLFQGALSLSLDALKKTGWGIFLLAFPGVAISVLLAGALFTHLLPFPSPIAYLLAALLSATDPVAVLDAMKKLKADRRLTTLLEGESLFNDGTAVVAFAMVLHFVKSGEAGVWPGLLAFARMTFGGLLVGALLGILLNHLTRIHQDAKIRISLSTILAYGSYLAADSLHVSGILSVIAAGIVYGNVAPVYREKREDGPLWDFWDYAAFLANSVVFLLIGTQVNSRSILGYWKPVLAAYAVVMAVRLLLVMVAFLGSRLLGQPLPFRWIGLSWWGGLRGALCLALAMSLMGTVPEAEGIYFVTLGLVFVFLFVNGLTAVFWTRMAQPDGT